MIAHHPPEDLLLGYAVGALPEAFDLALAAHLSLCDRCRAEVGAFEALGGALIAEDCGSEPVSDGCFDATLARILGDGAPPPDPKRPIRADPVLPAPLTDYVGGGLADVRWRRIGMGVKQAILPVAGTASARLLYIPAGTAMPDHGHTGTEITMVLQGAYSDAEGAYARGDVEVATDAIDHTPIADIGEDCICLAVCEGKLRFKGFLPRLAQPFLGL